MSSVGVGGFEGGSATGDGELHMEELTFGEGALVM